MMVNNKASLYVFGSLVVMVLLILLLWKPWEDEGISNETSLQIYCAAGMRRAVDEVVANYKKEYGVKVTVDSGPSGELLSRIKQVKGSLGDLYLPADSWYVDKLHEEGLAAENLSVGFFEAVMAVPKGNPKNIHSLNDLFKEDVSVGFGNPQASVGRTAKKVLEVKGLWKKFEDLSKVFPSKVTFLGTVTEVALHVKKKTVDVGIVWKATALQNGLEVIELEVFKKERQPIELTLLKKSKQSTAALQFARYLTARNRGVLSFEKHHFQAIEDGDVWVERPVLKLMYGSMLTPGLRQAIDKFKLREGVDFDEIPNGCGILVAQIKNGIVPEAYVACDDSFMNDVQDIFDSRVNLTNNFLVIVVRKGNPWRIKTLKDLKQDRLRVGLGHGINSAMGSLTKKMLEKYGIYESLKQGGHMREFDSGHMLVNTFLAPKAAAMDVMIVYRSNVMSNPSNLEKCEVIELNEAEAVATQPYAIAKKGNHKHLMKRFFDVVTSQENSEIFKEAGFVWRHNKK